MHTTTSTQESPQISPYVLSAFWFGTACHWLILLIVLMPTGVEHFVGPSAKGTYLGALMAIGGIIALILPPLIGAHSDRTGKRIVYIRFGVLVNIIGLAVMASAVSFFSGMSGFWIYVLGFIIVQLGNNYATAPYAALIPQLVPKDSRGQYSGVMALLQGLGNLVGAISTVIIGALHLPSFISFMVVGVIILIPALITIHGIPKEIEIPKKEYSITEKSSIGDLFKHKAFLWVFITRFLFSLGQYSVQPFFKYYIQDVLNQKNSERSLGILLLCIIFGSLFSAFFGGRISDKVGRKPVIYFAGTGLATVAVAFLFAPNFYVALGLAVLFGAGYGAFASVEWALGSDSMPNQRNYARDMGIWHLAVVLPQLSSSPQGMLLDWGNKHGINFGYTVVFSAGAIFYILGVILTRNIPEKMHTRK